MTLRARARFTDVMADAAFDLQGCSTVELRDQVARTTTTLLRLKRELDARTAKAPYPSRLPPSLVVPVHAQQPGRLLNASRALAARPAVLLSLIHISEPTRPY